jgi:hypothetical protein
MGYSWGNDTYTVRLFDLNDGTEVGRPVEKSFGVFGMMIVEAPDDRLLVISTRERRLHLWSVETARLLAMVALDSSCERVDVGIGTEIVLGMSSGALYCWEYRHT